MHFFFPFSAAIGDQSPFSVATAHRPARIGGIDSSAQQQT